jgi:hypothetical protein
MELSRLWIASLVTHGRIDLAQVAQCGHKHHALHLLRHDRVRPDAFALDAPLAGRDRVAKVFTHLFRRRGGHVIGYIGHLVFLDALSNVVENLAAHVATQLAIVETHEPPGRFNELVAVKLAVIGLQNTHGHSAQASEHKGKESSLADSRLVVMLEANVGQKLVAHQVVHVLELLDWIVRQSIF